MRIFANANTWTDGFGADWYSELSLKPIFESNLFLDIEGEIFSAGAEENWKPYSGKIEVDYGCLVNGKFYSECDEDCPDCDLNVTKCEIYEKGELIKIEYIEK